MSDIDTSGAIIELTHEAQTIARVTISQSTCIPIAGNFRELHSFVAILESFLQKFWGVSSFGAAKVSNS